MKNKRLIFIGLDVLVLIMVIGISLAVFNYAKGGTKKHEITIGGITMDFTEGDRNISIPVATPSYDEEGKIFGLPESTKCQNDTETGIQCYSDFTVTTTMNIDYSINYEVTLEKDNTSTLNNSDVRIYLEKQDENGNYKEVFTPKEYTEIGEDDELGAKSTEMLLDNGVVNKTTTYYYRLRMWVKGDYKITEEIKNYSAKVNVYGSNVEVNASTGITLSKDNVIVSVGKSSEPIIATVNPDNAKNKNLIWESADPSKVKVSSNGVVTGVSVTSTPVVVTVYTSDRTKSATFNVTVVDSDVESIYLPSSEINIVKGATGKVNASIKPDGASNKNMEYTSNNTNILRVLEDGTIITREVGTTTITITSVSHPGITNTLTVNVVESDATGINLTYPNITLDIGDSKNLEASVTPDTIDTVNLVYESLDTTVAKVSSNGEVTGVAEGTTQIRVTIKEYPEITAIANITVNKPTITKINMNSDISINTGQSTTFVLNISPDLGDKSKIVWDSSNESVATIPDSCNGNLSCTITGLTNGTTTIKAYVSDNTSVFAASTLSVITPSNARLSTYIQSLYNAGDSTLFYDGTSDNNLRYYGATPNNYVWFNNERWRIIGIFNNRVKLITTNPLENMVYDETGSNIWTRPATLNTYLNNTYYNNLSNTAKNLFNEATYYSGGWSLSDGSNMTSSVAYSKEKAGTSVNMKIGYIYTSDYAYASSNCYSTKIVSEYNNSTCVNSNWLYANYHEWIFARSYDYSTYNKLRWNDGSIDHYLVKWAYSVRSTLYLKSNVVVKQDGANGSYDHPYNITLGS